MEQEKNLTSELQRILDDNRDKRIVVVGTTCTGKTTFLKGIKGSIDQDQAVFPVLTYEERTNVNGVPWTSGIGRTMERLVKERVTIKKGQPMFGTIVVDADLVVYLRISDELLKERIKSRGVNFEDAKNMQKQIEENVKKSGLPTIEFFIG